MNGFFKNAALWVIIMIMVGLALFHLNPPASAKKELGPADFESQLQAGNIDNVAISKQGDLYTFRVALKTKIDAQQRFEFIYDVFPDEWRAKLNEQAIRFRIAPESTWLTALLINVLPLVLIFGVFWFFMFRQMQGGSNKALSFGKSRARLTSSTDKVVTFNDVAGVDEAKEELQEIIEFLKDPKKFSRLGGKIPKGVLLVGPPGTGKTLLARAVAGEAHAPFFSISGSDFVEMFVGVGASRVRDLFQQGQKHAPCIIFIDEIDAVGRQRGAGLGGGHDEREQTLNQLLVEMDGFSTSEGVILMAATNRPDVLDRALLRPGRFDRQVVVANPDITGREQILGIHIRNNGVPLAEDVTLRTLARGTPGFSGADLANMVNEAALLAARREQDKVSMQDFEDAKDRVLMGPERRSLALSVAERRNTAYHEAGHVLIGRLLKDADPVHKVTIIPRGPSLGATSMLPTEDRHSLSRAYLLASLRVLMGGRAAEEIIFNEFTSGAAGDLKVATDRAHAMVCEWGMSDLGPISFGTNAEVFLGRDFMKERQFSEETASSVDKAIHRFLEVAYADAKGLLTQHKDLLTAIAEELFERETLDADEIDDIIRRHGGADLIPPPPEPAPPQEPAPKPAAAPPPSVSADVPDIGKLKPGEIVPGTT